MLRLITTALNTRLADHRRRPHSGPCRACRIVAACLGGDDAGLLRAFRIASVTPEGLYRRVVLRCGAGRRVTALVCTQCDDYAAVVSLRGGPSKDDFWNSRTASVEQHTASHAAAAEVRCAAWGIV